MNDNRSIEENDLQAYVDNQLDPARRAEVESYLAVHPEDAKRVQTYQHQNELLSAMFDPVLDESVPTLLRRPGFLRWSRGLRYGAMAASLALAAILGWYIRGSQQEEVIYSTLAQQAAVAHVVYVPEVQHPVEVRADQKEHLTKWLSKRLGMPVHAPHLGTAGYELVGGRLLPGGGKPAAQFMYQDVRGQRLTLYISTDSKEGKETAFRYAREGDVSVFYWIDGSYGYALSGEMDRERLLTVAEAVYHELNR
jgi:anti-sigma factor RsiW